MAYENIINFCIASFLILISQILLIFLLFEIAYKKEYRFKQSRLFLELLFSFAFLIICIFVFGNSEENRLIFYLYLVMFSCFFIGYEIKQRNKEVNNKDLSKIIEFYENKELKFTSSLFYEINEFNEIEIKIISKIIKCAIFVLSSINIVFTTSIPILLFSGIINIEKIIIIPLVVLTLLLIEFYLFLSQENAQKHEKSEENGLLNNPEEWAKEIENKYGSEIIGYSNAYKAVETENSTTINNLEILAKDIIDGQNILLSNSSKYETKAIYYNVINKDFINGKATLIVYEDMPSVIEAKKIIDSIIEEYNNELIIKIISKNENPNTKTDKSINIYLGTVQDLIESNIDYGKIQTLILNNTDKIIQKNSNDLYVLATTLKNLNNDFQYIILSVVSDALRIAIKNILLIDSFKEYQINRKKALQTLGIQIIKRNANNIKMHENKNTYINDIVKLALETNKFNVDNIEIVSKKMAIKNDKNRFDEFRGKRNNELTNKELSALTDRIKFNTNSLFQENANKKMFIKNDDEKNLIYSIKAYSELNNGETYLGVVSSDYLLREYIISEYLKKKNDYSDLDIIIPQTMQNDVKILLGALLMQMFNKPVKEDVIIRRLKEYNKELVLIEGYNKLSIITAINALLETEFKIKTDITSYLLESIDELGKKEYMLNSNFKIKLPKDLYDKSKIIISGYEQKITQQKGYEIYQKYIPGQVHLIENNVYKIEDIENLDIIVSNVLSDKIRKYKQDVEINLSNIKENEIDEATKEFSSVILKTQIQNANIDINTLGYYEFQDFTTLEEGTYTYIKLPKAQQEKMNRNYYNNRVLKLQITPKTEESKKLIEGELKDKIACTLAFLLNEVFETLLDENAPYVKVKAVVSNKDILKNEEIKLYRPIIDQKVDATSISIYIIEDLKISKGLLTTIENELPRILSLIKKYLAWYNELPKEEETYVKRININNSLKLKETNKILGYFL